MVLGEGISISHTMFTSVSRVMHRSHRVVTAMPYVGSYRWRVSIYPNTDRTICFCTF